MINWEKVPEAILLIGGSFAIVTAWMFFMAWLDGEDCAFTTQIRHLWEIARWNRNVTIENNVIQHEGDKQRKRHNDDMMMQHLQLEEKVKRLEELDEVPITRNQLAMLVSKAMNDGEV